MTLEDFYFISQIVAALGIMASLVFVGVQLQMGRKQAEEDERVARGQVIQAIASEHRQHSVDLAAYPQIYHYFVGDADPKDMTDEEKAQFATFAYATLHMAQNMFFQHQRGLLDDRTYQSYIPMLAGFLSNRAAQRYWQERRGFFFDPDFVEMMDDRFAEARPLAQPIVEAENEEAPGK